MDGPYHLMENIMDLKKGTIVKRFIRLPHLKNLTKKFGFIEPLKYFVPSIGISQIVKADDDIVMGDNKKLLIFGALGNNPSEGDMSIHFLFTDKNYNNIYDHNFFEINNRIRDMIVLNKI